MAALLWMEFGIGRTKLRMAAATDECNDYRNEVVGPTGGSYWILDSDMERVRLAELVNHILVGDRNNEPEKAK
ncbi:MAG: hypothetical protein A2Y38_17070 [Spirochaetes bacterium GWB1_59_5]|nr:MAG: hypothetical protein A2Y38_17070 [Spirochaetes bacterium GWB1_59_5]